MKFETTNPPVDLCCAVQGLTDAQSSAIREMGFESIKSLSIHKIPTGLGQQLLVNYDHKRNELNVGSHIIKITPSKVHDVLGVPMGKIPVYENRSVRIGDVNRKKWRKQFVQEHITVKHVVDKLKSCRKGGKLFKLNFLVVFNSIMGETTKSGTVNQKCLASIKVRNIGNMDWCSYIITCLKSTKEGWNGKEPYNGPLTFLAILYAHEKQLTRCPGNTITPAIQYVTIDSLVNLESSMPEVDPFSQFIEVPIQFETHIESAGGQSGEIQPQTDDSQIFYDQNKNVPLHQEDEVQPQTYESQTAIDQNVCILQDEEVDSLFQSTNPDSVLNLKLPVGPPNAQSTSGLSDTLGHCNQLEPRRDEKVENFSSGQSGIVCVGCYKVKQSVAKILKAILEKHGDIAAECVMKTDFMRSSILEAVCEVAMQIQANDVTKKPEEIESRVLDAKAVNIDVSWLEVHIQKRKEAIEMYNLLMNIKANHLSVIKAAEINLRKRRAELEDVVERSREAKRRMGALRHVGKNLTDNFFESKAKIDSWVMDPIV